MGGYAITIRNFRPEDRASVRELCCDTAFMGESMERFFDDRKLFADVAISYYTDFEPESLWVAEKEGQVVGYLAGCRDTRRYKKIFGRKILPKALFDLFARGTLFRNKTVKFMLGVLKSLFRGELCRPDCQQGFPAHLHINVKHGYRDFGVGTQLINRFLDYLKSNRVVGVHMYSFSPVGKRFFEKLNFTTVFSQRVSYFEHLQAGEVKVSCFAKRLNADG